MYYLSNVCLPVLWQCTCKLPSCAPLICMWTWFLLLNAYAIHSCSLLHVYTIIHAFALWVCFRLEYMLFALVSGSYMPFNANLFHEHAICLNTCCYHNLCFIQVLLSIALLYVYDVYDFVCILSLYVYASHLHFASLTLCHIYILSNHGFCLMIEVVFMLTTMAFMPIYMSVWLRWLLWWLRSHWFTCN